MTIKNKIATSLVASALIATASFAGSLSYPLSGTNGAKVAQELFELGDYNATISQNTNRLTYKAEVSPTEFGGSISDPLINLTFDGNVTLAENHVFALVDDDNKTVAVQDEDPVNGVYRLQGNSDTSVVDGKSYTIFTVDANTAVDANATNTNQARLVGAESDFNAAKANLELWSTSGTPTKVDTASAKLFDTTPQYSVYCENKLNNLINVENGSFTFISTKHGALKDQNGSNGDIMNVLTDVMRFKVVKNAVDFGLDGNASVLAITADANMTNYMPTVTSDFALVGTPDAADITHSAYDINVTDNNGTDNGFVGNAAYSATYTVNFEVNGTAQVQPTKFYANFYINETGHDYNTTVTPKGDYTADAFVGSWEQFAYIAQISGATEDANTKTKLFITNRSCKAVNPIVKLIANGKTVDLTLDSIAVDSQGKFLLGNIITANKDAITAAGLSTTGRYAVEITIPGNAEDFYVYAQAQSKTDIAATKDLPVYSTSTRTN